MVGSVNDSGVDSILRVPGLLGADGGVVFAEPVGDCFVLASRVLAYTCKHKDKTKTLYVSKKKKKKK